MESNVLDKENYNYAASCDGGRLQFFYASDEHELNRRINELADANNAQDVKLYRVDLTLVPLKKRVILTV